MSSLTSLLKEQGFEVKEHFPLAQITTLRVGGPARWYVQTENSARLVQVLQIAEDRKIPFKVLGNGSNVLISDEGFDGLIIHNSGGRVTLLDEGEVFPQVRVRVDAGVRLAGLIRQLWQMNVSGLEWFAGIPATVGGALYMNAHGGKQFFGDFVVKAALFKNGVIREVTKDYFKFAYDFSILHQTGETVLWVELNLVRNKVYEAQQLYKEWAQQKSFQPQRSAGCIFQNLTLEQQKRLKLPTPSVGYFIDKILGLKGARSGDAFISTDHAAFIVNNGRARANDVWRLIQLVQQKAVETANIELRLEIELVGNFPTQ